MKPVGFTSAKVIYFVVILNVLCLSVKSEDGCPPPEDIKPCICYNSPYTVLECISVQSESILKDVFVNSKGYNYREVHLQFTTLKYLPKEMFDNAGVSELFLQNSTLNTIFDSPPESLHSLYKLHLENTKIVDMSHWELFEPLTHLKILTVYYNYVEEIGPTFSEYVTKDLSQISFYATGTKRIIPGAFVDFKKLDKVGIDNCKLKEISRDIFPRPFSVRDLYFNGNELKVIPNDMFVDMPSLNTVGLKDNLLTTVPESAFGGNAGRLNWLFLSGNPLRCNCDLLWLVNNKPKYISGSCATPIRIHDKPLEDLTEKDFKC